MINLSSDNASVRQISVDILAGVFENGIYSDELVAEVFQRNSLNQLDRSLLIELVNGTIRWRGQLDWLLAKYFKGDYFNSPIKLRSILELSLYQLKFLNKIPKYAAVSEGVEIAKKEGGKAWGNKVNGILRSYIRNENSIQLPAINKDPVSGLCVRYSHPKWLVQRWLGRYGLESTKSLCDWNNRRPDITVRVNLKKTTREALLGEFKSFGVEASPSEFFNDFIKLTKPRDITKLSAFCEGFFSIQDESTAIASLLLEPEKGDVILDMCAAPGGKACHIAELIEDNGRVVAVDRNFKRISLLKENINRLKIRSILPIVGDSTKMFLSSVDKVLLDAPCSGTGVLSKRTDLRWQRKLDDIFKIKKLQKTLLESAALLLKKGGILVYSTCTLEPEENEEVIKEFLNDHSNFQIVNETDCVPEYFITPAGYWVTFPPEHEMDGVFAVKLMKTK